MEFISAEFYIFLIILLILYYVCPLEKRWFVLLLGSIGFYYSVAKTGIIVLLYLVVFSYTMGIVLYRLREDTQTKKKLVLWISIVGTVLPLFLMKYMYSRLGFIAPIGMSFYTLQIISYLVDIYRGSIKPQNNFFKYMLFLSFFPQIFQGPIPRYSKLSTQLYLGHTFDEKEFTKGIYLIIWGFFLKFMVADKASVIVNTVLDNDGYKGFYS